jgi:hypothetical protein
MFRWIAEQVRAAVSGGAIRGLADVGLVPEDATPEQVRALLAQPAAIEDKPTKGKRQ